MADRNSEPRLSMGDAASVAWLISFGDLLTLLVCFFLILTPWNVHRQQNKEIQDQEVAQKKHNQDKHGTNFAGRLTGQKLDLIANIPIVRSKLVAAPEGVRAELVSRLKSILPENGTEAALMTVTLCDPRMRAELFNVLRSMDGDGVQDSRALQVELTHTCEARTELDPSGDEVVGRIVIESER